MWLVSILGCPQPDPVQIPDPPIVETGFVGSGDLDATCSVDPDQPLWLQCTVRPGGAAPAHLEAWHPEHPDRIRRASAADASTEHTLLLWGFKADTPVQWRIESGDRFRTGQLTTGALPTNLAVGYHPIFGETEAQGILASASCAGAKPHIVDRDGDIVWFADVTDRVGAGITPTISALHRTPDDTVLMVLGREQILEIDLVGATRLSLTRGIDFEHYVHHDIFRHQGHTYVPYAHTVTDKGSAFLVDGVYVFDGAGALVAQASVGDLWPLIPDPDTLEGYWASLFPLTYDVSHANAVSVDASGDIVVSFRHLHAVVGLDGDLGSDGFGQLRWTLVGDPASVAAPGDVAMSAPDGVEAGFLGQHDAHLAADGTLLLLDNRLGTQEPARGLRMAFDPVGGTAEIVTVYDLDLVCPIQGTVRDLPSGQVLATCSSSGELMTFPAHGGLPTWRMRAECGPGLPIVSIPRGIPWELW